MATFTNSSRSLNGDEFFRHGRMQGHGAIEISFAGAHSHGNGGHQNDLRRMLSHHVAPQHYLVYFSTTNFSRQRGPEAGSARAIERKRAR